MHVERELVRAVRHYPRKAPPIPVAFSGLGQVGYAHPRTGVRWNPLLARHVRAVLRDEARAEHLVRELSGGRLGAGDVLPVLALGTDSRDAIAAITRHQNAITSWDDLIRARGSGKYWDYIGTRASQTTVGGAWSGFARSAGNYPAVSPANIPGGSALDRASTGAFPVVTSHSGAEDVYLANFGVQHLSSSNVVLWADLLVGAANISANTASAQTIDTTELPARGTNGVGVMMILEVTTALGTTASNLTVSYTNQDGTSGRTTASAAMTTSCITFRLQPVAAGVLIPLVSGDYGVQSVETITFSAAMGQGALVLWLYRPLVLLPTLATTTFVERSTPAQVAGMVKLTHTAGGTVGCLNPFVLCSTSSTGVQTYFVQLVWG